MRRLGVAALAVATAVVAACGQESAPAPAETPGRTPFGPPRVQKARDVLATPPFERLTQGSGAELEAGDVVTCRYELSLAADGKVIDTTKDLDEPFVFEVGAGHLIPGWERLAEELRVGDRVRARIPSDLGYGDPGVPDVVPPAADLVLDLEIVAVVPPPTWEVLKAGDGAPVTPGSTVTVHYVGTLPDGKEFDNSRKADAKPYRFPVGAGAEIEGWDRVVPQMRVGDRWKVTVPWAFAYGAQGRPPRIPPQTDLTYDIEVLAVEGPEESGDEPPR